MKQVPAKSIVYKLIILCLFLCPIMASTLVSQFYNRSNDEVSLWKNMTLKNHVFISAYVGHGSYSMYKMRKLQNDLTTFYGIPAIKNSSFPPYWLYGLSISQKYDASRFGFNFELLSTGARMSLADYSGQYTSDFICRGQKLGVFIEKDLSLKIKEITNLSFGYRIEAGGIYSKVDQQTLIQLNGVEDGEGNLQSIMKMISTAYYLEPALFAKWHLDNKTAFQFSVGGMLDFPSEFLMTNMTSYQIGWAGYRIKLGILRQL